MSFLLSSAFADTAAAAPQGGSPYSSIFLLVGFFAIFYFLFIRPQNKRAREQRQMLANLKVDDAVVTTGGIVGIIHKIEDNFITLKIAKDVEIKIQKNAIASALPKDSVEV